MNDTEWTQCTDPQEMLAAAHVRRMPRSVAPGSLLPSSAGLDVLWSRAKRGTTMLYEQRRGRYQKEAAALWNELVPPSGQAETVQGELIRCVGRLSDECTRNGNINWSDGFVLMAEYLRRHLCDGTFDQETSQDIAEDVDDVVAAADAPETVFNVEDEDTFDRLTDRVVEWCQRHPEPIAHVRDERLKR